MLKQKHLRYYFPDYLFDSIWKDATFLSIGRNNQVTQTKQPANNQVTQTKQTTNKQPTYSSIV